MEVDASILFQITMNMTNFLEKIVFLTPLITDTKLTRLSYRVENQHSKTLHNKYSLILRMFTTLTSYSRLILDDLPIEK